MLMLDTDVLIDIQRANAAAVTWSSSLTELPVVPGFVVMELIQDAQNAPQVRQVQRLFAPLPIVWPSSTDCEIALDLFLRLHLSHGLVSWSGPARCPDCGHSAWACCHPVYVQYQTLPERNESVPAPALSTLTAM